MKEFMNFQYENEEDSSLVGSFKQTNPYPSLIPDAEMQKSKGHSEGERRSEEEIKKTPAEIVHLIEYGDTLEGLSLTYDVPISKIKQRNGIESDIYYLKTLIIPNPLAQPEKTKEKQESLKIEEFMCYMSIQEKSTKSARYYLSENDWNVEEAVNEYKQDLEWERNNVIHTKPFKSNPTPKKYREQELMYKKYI